MTEKVKWSLVEKFAFCCVGLSAFVMAVIFSPLHWLHCVFEAVRQYQCRLLAGREALAAMREGLQVLKDDLVRKQQARTEGLH